MTSPAVVRFHIAPSPPFSFLIDHQSLQTLTCRNKFAKLIAIDALSRRSIYLEWSLHSHTRLLPRVLSHVVDHTLHSCVSSRLLFSISAFTICIKFTSADLSLLCAHCFYSSAIDQHVVVSKDLLADSTQPRLVPGDRPDHQGPARNQRLQSWHTTSLHPAYKLCYRTK